MAASSIVKQFTDGSIIISDSTGTPITHTVKFDRADFSISGLKAKLRNTVAYEHKGIRSSVRHTSRIYPTFSFSCDMSEFTAVAGVSISDVVLRNGAFASAVSTLGANAEVMLYTVQITVEGTSHGDSADHTFSMVDCELSIDFSMGEPNSFAVNGTLFGEITGDLATS